jgi:4-hydroxybenzoate polyprenyltransferase
MKAGAYLRLGRVSNLPTIWTNVLAGVAISGTPIGWRGLVYTSAAVSLLYVGGMVLNDVCDAPVDARERAERPIPRGLVSRREAFGAAVALLAAGLVALGAGSHAAVALPWGLALVAAIAYYDWRHKRDRFGPLVMGLCRGLVYLVASAAASGTVRPRVILAAALLAAYVVSLTVVARRAGARATWGVPALIAGISLLDAAVVALFGPWEWSLAAVAAFVLTLVLQRLVPGN